MTTSEWVSLVDGKLVYKTTDKGDRIIDFSNAGFAGGGVALPTDIPVLITLTPSGEDDTDAIQKAIDQVSLSERDRYRGIVKFGPGIYKISKTITINASGVILTGCGSTDEGTIIEMIGSKGFLAFQIGSTQTPVYSSNVFLTSSYIKSGSKSVRVSSTDGLSVGQRIVIRRTVTSEWIKYLGMDKLIRDGVKQTWIKEGDIIDTPRTITAIEVVTNTIKFDAPLTDSFDSVYLGKPVGALCVVENPGRISWVGIEHLQIKAPVGTAVYSSARFSNVINGYLYDIVSKDTQNAFSVNIDSLQITLDTITNSISTAQTASAPTADFSVTGSLVLLNKCKSDSDGTWAFVTGAKGVGPTVLLNFSTTHSVGIGPHQRWYTGLLVDNAFLPNATKNRPGIAFTNRGTAGSGHGWTTAGSVAWNVRSPYFKVQAAPGTINWAIGCIGNNVSLAPVGIFDSLGESVTPNSLYLEQLKLRKGVDAIHAIGY